MHINTLLNEPNDYVLYHDDFRTWYESWLPFMQKTPQQKINVPAAIAYKYQGDFYGLLSHYGVPHSQHFFTMIFNNYKHSGDYDGTVLYFDIPDPNTLEKIYTLYQTAAANL